MSPILTALKALYVALGGALTDHYDDIAGGIPVSQMILTADLVACLSKLSIGIELPAVTAADDGDVLTVVGGKWAKAAGGGGGSKLYAHNIRVLDESEIALDMYTTIISSSSTAMTLADLIGYITTNAVKVPVSGTSDEGSGYAPAWLFVSDGDLTCQTNNPTTAHSVAEATVTDTVVEL